MNLRPKISPNLDQVGDSGGGGSASFADLTGSPTDNAALVAYLEDIYVKKNDSSDRISIDSENRMLYKTGNLSTIDWQNGYLATGNGVTVEWLNGILRNSGTGLKSVNWNDAQLLDFGDNASLDWYNRTLYDSSFNLSLDWKNRNLYEKWFINNDLEFSDTDKGPVLIDRTLGTAKRIYISGNTILVEDV